MITSQIHQDKTLSFHSLRKTNITGAGPHIGSTDNLSQAEVLVYNRFNYEIDHVVEIWQFGHFVNECYESFDNENAEQHEGLQKLFDHVNRPV